jgi:hypothetical protein
VFFILSLHRVQHDSEHRELYNNMGMRMQHTIFLMMTLKSFRPEEDKKHRDVSYLTEFSYFPLNGFLSESCRTWSDQVKMDLLKWGGNVFSHFSLIFSYFIFFGEGRG